MGRLLLLSLLYFLGLDRGLFGSLGAVGCFVAMSVTDIAAGPSSDPVLRAGVAGGAPVGCIAAVHSLQAVSEVHSLLEVGKVVGGQRLLYAGVRQRSDELLDDDLVGKPGPILAALKDVRKLSSGLPGLLLQRQELLQGAGLRYAKP